MLKLSKRSIALLLQNLLRGRSFRLCLADLFVEAAHTGGTELSQLERLLESLSLALLYLLLLDCVVLGCFAVRLGTTSMLVFQDLASTLHTFSSVLFLNCMKIILELSQLFLLVTHLLLLPLHGEGINTGLSMLGLVLLEPIVLCLDLL